MTVYRVTLTTEDGEVLDTQTVSTEYDFDPEDLDDEGEFDWYLESEESPADVIVAGDIGTRIVNGVRYHEEKTKG